MQLELQLGADAPWRARFRAPSVQLALVAAAAPERGLVVADHSGVYQLYAWDVPSGALRRLTDRPAGTRAGWISPAGDAVYYLDDHQGDATGHFVRVPFAGGPPVDITPDLPPYAAEEFAFSRDGAWLGFIHADAAGFHAWILPVAPDGSPGAPRRLFTSPALAQGLAFAPAGDRAALLTQEGTGAGWFRLRVLDTATGRPLADLWDGPESSVEVARFAPAAGDPRLVATSTRSGATRPLLWNPDTGARDDLPLAGLPGDVQPVDWSADGRRLLLVQTYGAAQHLWLYDLATGQVTGPAPAGGAVGFVGVAGWQAAYFAPSGEIWAHWQNSVQPPQLRAFDGATGAPGGTVLAAGALPPGHPWRSVTFPSSDGTPVQGWCAVPDGPGPFPTILHTHGGPTFAMGDLFHPGSQAWLDHGFAFLTVNYRGSTTFGRVFQEQIRGDIGHWELEDMVAARAWAVAAGIARPDAVLLTGASYGGYLTLLALGKRAELWAGGMALVALADPVLAYEDELDQLKVEDAIFFGGTPTEVPERWTAASPLTYADRVQSPILVIQGRNDPTCPPRQLLAYEARLRSLGKAIDVQWFDAGHGTLDTAERLAQQEQMLQFAARVLAPLPGG